MSDLKVSICCLAYNHEHYIRQCLDGFVMQKCNFNFEVLIHDDASTDNTAAIIKEYEVKYSEIIKPVYQTENQHSKGIKPTINFNFPRAKGEYIALCEGDDYWTDPLKLQKQVDFLENNPNCSFCFHKAKRQTEDSYGNIIADQVYPSGLNKNVLSTAEYFQIQTTATCTLMYKNEKIKVLDKLYHSHGDFLLYCELLHFGSAGFIDEVMSVYRKHEKGVSYNYFSKKYLYNRIKELKKEQSYFVNENVSNEIYRIRLEHIVKYIELYKDDVFCWRTFIIRSKFKFFKKNIGS